MQEVVKCPQCSSNKVKENHIVRNLTLTGALLMLIPIFGWITGPIILAVAWSTHYNMKKRSIKPMVCNECRRKFQVDDDTYNTFKNEIQKASI